MSEETITYNLEIDVSRAYDDVRKLETLLYRSFALLQRLGLPLEINQVIETIQRATMSIRLMHSALIALYAASGPIGWALAAVGIASASLTVGDMLYDATRSAVYG